MSRPQFAAEAAADQYTGGATGEDVNAATWTTSFRPTAAMDDVAVLVEDAAGSFHVEIRFQDGSGSTRATRDDDSDGQYSGDGSTDVFVETAIAAEQVEVAVVDDSGAANSVDISVRAA